MIYLHFSKQIQILFFLLLFCVFPNINIFTPLIIYNTEFIILFSIKISKVELQIKVDNRKVNFPYFFLYDWMPWKIICKITHLNVQLIKKILLHWILRGHFDTWWWQMRHFDNSSLIYAEMPNFGNYLSDNNSIPLCAVQRKAVICNIIKIIVNSDKLCLLFLWCHGFFTTQDF